MFREGAGLVRRTKGRLSLELKCVILGGMKVLNKIQELDYNTLTTRPTLARKDKFSILIQALMGFRRATRFSEAGPPETGGVDAPEGPRTEEVTSQ